jgi:hypothetical protein
MKFIEAIQGFQSLKHQAKLVRMKGSIASAFEGVTLLVVLIPAKILPIGPASLFHEIDHDTQLGISDPDENKPIINKIVKIQDIEPFLVIHCLVP